MKFVKNFKSFWLLELALFGAIVRNLEKKLKGKKLAIFGAGYRGRGVLSFCNYLDLNVELFIDDYKSDEFLSGIEVVNRRTFFLKYKEDIDRILVGLGQLGDMLGFNYIRVPEFVIENVPEFNISELYSHLKHIVKNDCFFNNHFPMILAATEVYHNLENDFDKFLLRNYMIKYGIKNTYIVNDENHFYKVPEYGILVKDGDIVLDCGAYRGNITRSFSKYCGNKGLVIAIEPLQQNIKIIEKRFNDTYNVKPIHLAVSKFDGVGKLVFSIEDKICPICRNSIKDVPDDLINRKDIKIIDIKFAKIDSLVHELSLEKIDFIKMDIEGTELDALKGAFYSIKKFIPKLAISVYHLKNDIYEIPKYLKELLPEYNFFIKQTEAELWVGVKLFGIKGEK